MAGEDAVERTDGEHEDPDADAPAIPDNGLPYLPPSTPTPTPTPPPLPTLPTLPSQPGTPSTSEEPDGDDEGMTLADRLATRNVPATEPRADYGIPLVQSTHAVTPPAGAPAQSTSRGRPLDPRSALGLPTKREESEPFVRPELASMGPSTTAMLIGRGLMVVAALLVGIAARRSTGAGAVERGEAFWPVTISAGVFTAVGVAGLVFWVASYADNGRRLQARAASPRAMALTWLAPVLWVAFSCLTYLQIDAGGDLDPLPGVAAISFAIALAVPFARLQALFRKMTRRPPIVWFGYLLDLFAFGLLWWRLTDWPSPIAGGDADHVRLTANVAFGAAALLTINGLYFGWLAQQASHSVYERLGRLEARHRSDDEGRPAWFQAGMQVQPGAVAPVDQRPLMNTGPLSGAVALFHVLWGLATIALAIALIRFAFEYNDRTPFVGEVLEIDDDDAVRIGTAAAAVVVVYVITIVVHATWGVLAALNARRVTVHAPNPASFGVLFAPMPVLVVAGLLIGGTVGYWIVIAGLGFAFFAPVLLNRMLMALSARLGGQLRGFGQWTAFITAIYLVGVAENFLFSRAVGRLGFLATAALVQGAFMILGGVVGYRAMRALEETLSDHRQVHRVQPG